MIRSAIRMICLLIASLVLINCAGNKSTPPAQAAASSDSSLLTPTKDILVTSGDINKKYVILGKVEYMSKGNSVYSDQIAANKEAEEFLKKVAFTKYGNKVDAIINTKTLATMKGGFWGAVGAGYGARNMATSLEGLAVSFEDSQKQEATSSEADEVVPTKKARKKGKSKSRKAR